jgi:hypothetical protein
MTIKQYMKREVLMQLAKKLMGMRAGKAPL